MYNKGHSRRPQLMLSLERFLFRCSRSYSRLHLIAAAAAAATSFCLILFALRKRSSSSPPFLPSSSSATKDDPYYYANRSVPDWFHDAKFGIFIHWGLFSVPAWAEKDMDFGKPDNKRDRDRKNWFKHNSYAEWYYNTIRIDGSPAQRHHVQTYGKDFQYDDFVPMFDTAVEQWDPAEMASLLEQVHAKYVVLVTKHHDGFLLWPSRNTASSSSSSRQRGGGKEYNYASKRDIVRELGTAVRGRGMHMGYYYSGGIDWTFNDGLITERSHVYRDCNQSMEYLRYADSHWRELIDEYETSILWNDICFAFDQTATSNASITRQTEVVDDLFSHFYKKRPTDGIINDRFYQKDANLQNVNPTLHHDIVTPEYRTFDTIQEKKWESCRGIGKSFGYNQLEGPDDYLSTGELVRSLVDIVSKNGNFLLNVGPMANGTIATLQAERLKGLGRWLDVNGEAVFGTRPWVQAASTTNETGVEIRFTQQQRRSNSNSGGGEDNDNDDDGTGRDPVLYVILMGMPKGPAILLNDLELSSSSVVTLTLLRRGGGVPLQWRKSEKGTAVTLPPGLLDPSEPAHSIKVTGAVVTVSGGS